MAKNPLLQKKYDEGRAAGIKACLEMNKLSFSDGYDQGLKEGIARSTAFFMEKFEGLKDVEGIGPKTIQRLKEQLGEQYFED